jgi:hypothetical protein
MPCDIGKLKFISMTFSSIISVDLTALETEACWDLTLKIGFATMSGNLDFPVTSLRWCFPKNGGAFSRLLLQFDNFAIFIIFPKSQGQLMKNC